MRRLGIFASACAALLQGMPASAANLQISPVSIRYQSGQTAASIALQNLGDTPVFGQVRVFHWTQKDGIDVLTPTDQLVASPPIVEIAPRSTQTVRLIRRAAVNNTAELSYRIVIDEIPPDAGPGSGVDIRLRYSVPVFMMPAASNAAPKLTWKLF